LNRRGGEDALAREVARTRRHRTPLSLALLDLDHFKRVNDEYGHPVGDAVLRIVASRVLQTLRITDAAARWGGEEILLVLPDAALPAARMVVDRVRLAIAQAPPGELPAVTVSAGVAEIGPDDESWRPVVARADEKLYQAKAEGRNCVR
jgi:diguanylate cyclase (GGDEF)-like protein